MELLEKISAAVVGAAFGALITWLRTRPKERRDAAIAYLEAIIAALQEMVKDFKDGKVPHKSGRTLVGALEVFNEAITPILEEKDKNNLLKLQALENEATRIDAELYGQNIPSEQIKTWIVDAERVAGDLGTVIAKLKAKW